MTAERLTYGDMSWQMVRFPIPLEKPPEVVAAGIGHHGRERWERYLLPDLWCLHLYPYTASVRLDQKLFPIQPGFVGITPPDTKIEYEYSNLCTHLFVHFRCELTSDDKKVSTLSPIPAMQDLGVDFPRLYARLEQVIVTAGQHNHRTQARVWDTLCEISWRAERLTIPERPGEHPAVRFAVMEIERQLGETLSVVELAQKSGVSYSYLGRLFQQAFGTTVVGYIRARRMERAEHLLRHSTLSVKAIAATVGIPDLHLFNKIVRRDLGMSPRLLRQESEQKQTG